MLRYRKYFYILSFTLVAGSIFALLFLGLRLGIDFTGGSMMEVAFKDTAPSHEMITNALAEFELGEVVIQGTGQAGMILRFREVDEILHQKILGKLQGLGSGNSASTSVSSVEERRFEAVGPVIGKEIKEKTFWAILLAIILMLIYVAWAFQRVSFPVRSWVYGIVAIITLCHDVLITVGVFSLLGYILHIEVGVPFIAAMLTVWGYSVNDTIVIFDRIRENLLRQGSGFDFGKIIDQSVRQTFVRSLNTSLTVLFSLLAIFFFGGESIRYFVLALIVGVVIGSYSSLFLASPLLFSWAMLERRKKGKS